jgi:Lipase (class 3)
MDILVTPKKKQKTNSRMASSQPVRRQEPSDPLTLALRDARRKLWKTPPRYLPRLFSPLREFVLDPGMAIAGTILPLTTRNAFPWVNALLARVTLWMLIPVLQFFYRYPTAVYINERRKSRMNQDMKMASRVAVNRDLKRGSRFSLLRPSIGRVILIQRPSETKSFFYIVQSFIVNIIADVFGALSNPTKYQVWVDACTQLQSYLIATGVSAELYQAIIDPLLQGRLLFNIKVLANIQERHLCVDRPKAAQFPMEEEEETSSSSSPSSNNLTQELNEGHKWMRFATAAYGTEMILSALDREVEVADGLCLHDELGSAIAFHCQIPEEDILFICNEIEPHKHTLPHFLAVDHDTRSVVLALRGTLSVTEGIIDFQGMARDYCTGQAHAGMAAMAESVWDRSGDAILKILKEDQYQGYIFVITGHSLGGGAACLLNVKLHVEGLLGPKWPIRCFAFAAPPTFLVSTAKEEEKEETKTTDDDIADGNIDTIPLPTKISQAMQNCVAYIHDRDAVPHLSVAGIRRLAWLLNTVDHQTVRIPFWRRWRIYYDYDPIPDPLIAAVVIKVAGGMGCPRDIQGAFEPIIPARVVVWCHNNETTGKFEPYACDPVRVAQCHVFVWQDMLSDHLPEQYENALDALILES